MLIFDLDSGGHGVYAAMLSVTGRNNLEEGKKPMLTRPWQWSWLPLFAVAMVWPAEAVSVQPADALGDHMVLQRNKPAPIWGTANPGETVTVEFAGQTRTTVAGVKGHWLVRFDPLEASTESRRLTIKAPSGMVELTDVLVGDVWIAGGQSNMGRNFRASWQPDDFKMNFPHIRFLHVVSPGAEYPTSALKPTMWPRRGKPFSRDNRWNVCVGDVGTDCAAVGFFFAHRVYEETGIPQGLLWNAVGGSTANEWIPRFGWWLRPELETTAREVDAWYPGTEIGRKAYAEALEVIAAWTDRADEAVRKGHPFPYPQPMLPQPPNPGGRNRGLTFLYNGRLHPLVPYAIRGIVWYQGESDYANRAYRFQIEAMVESWRKLFVSPGEKPEDLPFYFVQMQRSGSYMSPDVRDRQYQSYFTVPNAGMAVLLDLDVQLHPWNKYDAGRRLALWALARDYGRDVVFSGPIYKSHHTEGSAVVVEFDHTHGGLFIGKKFKLEPVEKLPDGELVNLEITRDGRAWVPARSRIDGEKLAVWAEGLDDPTHVRYCWKSIADEPFLYNKASMPAGQFNTQTLDQILKKGQQE